MSRVSIGSRQVNDSLACVHGKPTGDQASGKTMPSAEPLEMIPSLKPCQSPEATPQDAEVQQRYPVRLTLILCTTAIVLGAIHAWVYRNVVMPDGISYLEVGEAYLRGDWKQAVNGLWSPFYSWELAAAVAIFQPSPYWEFPVMHLVNYVNYLCALAGFTFFIQQLVKSHRLRSTSLAKRARLALSEDLLVILGYTLFMWGSLWLIPIRLTSPDMLVAAIVYVACGALIRMRRGNDGAASFAFFGVLLGTGYLVKAFFFPFAFVLLFVAVCRAGHFQVAFKRLCVALATFCAVSGPFVMAISVAKERFTFGDAGTLNYAGQVNGQPAMHWQGVPANSGVPKHPTRKVNQVPVIYEYAEPIHATYPPWYDPSYWRDGTEAHIDLGQNLAILIKSLKRFLLREWGLEYCFLGGLITLFLMSGLSAIVLGIPDYWYVLVPACLAIGMFAVVQCEPRYVAGFILVIVMTSFALVNLPSSQESARLAACVTTSMVILAALVILPCSGALRFLGEATHIIEIQPFMEWKVACALKEMGLRDGDCVAFIGEPIEHCWARLARLRIIAEIDKEDTKQFLAASNEEKERVMEIFRRTGARVVVGRAADAPVNWRSEDWRFLGGGYYAYRL